MDDHAFRALVAQHEMSCRHAPRRFLRQTAAWALLGHAVIGGVLLLAAAGLLWALGGLLAGRFHFWRLLLIGGCASLLWSLLQALWTPSAPLPGRRLRREEAPRLFELIDKLRRRAAAPPLDEVVLDDQLNAAIVQQPRLGVLGWHRNSLVLGLPLLMGLDSRQAAAVMAHEFGHLRAGHAKLGAWLYRTRRSWWLLARDRQRARFGPAFADLGLQLFFQHFFPRFNARAFVLARQQEVEADRLAHQLVGAPPAAQGLLALGVLSRYLAEDFWPRVWARCQDEATPQARPLQALRRLLPGALRHEEAPRWLRDGLKTLPEPSDTHPSLRDRIELAQARPELPPPPARSAAEQLLGVALLDQLCEELDQQWQLRSSPAWTERHRALLQARRQIEELAAADAEAPLPLAERLLWVRSVWQLDGPGAAVPLLRETLQRHRAPAEARYLLGRALLDGLRPLRPPAQQPDSPELREALGLLQALADEGRETLSHEQALASDPQWRLPAARLLEDALAQREAWGPLKDLRERLRTLERQSEEALARLHDFDGEQRLSPARLGPRVLRSTLDMLRREASVGRAWLWRKTDPGCAGWALHLLVIERSQVLGQPDAEHWWAHLREQLDLPLQCMVIDLGHPYWRDIARADLVLQFKGEAEACIYRGRSL